MAYTDTVRQVRHAYQQMRASYPGLGARNHGQVKAAFASLCSARCTKTVETRNPGFIAGVLKTRSSLFSNLFLTVNCFDKLPGIRCVSNVLKIFFSIYFSFASEVASILGVKIFPSGTKSLQERSMIEWSSQCSGIKNRVENIVYLLL